jgi:hypothetical protein
MKKLTVGLMLTALALLPLAQAGEKKTSNKQTCTDKAACADKAKTVSSANTACSGKSACCEKEKVARKVANPDEKGATFLVRR